MLKLTITQLGTPKTIITKHGPKEKNWLKAQEYNDKFLNYWLNATTRDWKVGMTVDVESVEERTYPSAKTGKDEISYDIKFPKFGGNPELEARIAKLEAYIKAAIVPALKDHNDRLKALEPRETTKVAGTDIDYPESMVPNFEPQPDDEMTLADMAEMEAELKNF